MVTQETFRREMQLSLDSQKSFRERNILGQFSTPYPLARQMVHIGLALLNPKDRINFLDPAFGTGVFYSALLEPAEKKNIKQAIGYEIDPHYGTDAQKLWHDTLLDLKIQNFLTAKPPAERNKYNLVICNPPYVRHHHIATEDKKQLRDLTATVFGMVPSGLSGLYTYFIAKAHQWMAPGAISAWLIPSEFMDVNYGKALKKYLTEKVSLLSIHRFDPKIVQFDDALVSSAIVILKNELPAPGHTVQFTFGNDVISPDKKVSVPNEELKQIPKWLSNLKAVPGQSEKTILSDWFTIKRGVATGDNSFFILDSEKALDLKIERQFLRPILPSPRYLSIDKVSSLANGEPAVQKKLFLIDCGLSEKELPSFSGVFSYLQSGASSVSNNYLNRSRKVWYFQEKRSPAPLLFTYMGRNRNGHSRPFSFILNESNAIATNSYLMLFPKEILQLKLTTHPDLIEHIWEGLNNLPVHCFTEEGRVYGGGLHKMEPKELANLNISSLTSLLT